MSEVKISESTEPMDIVRLPPDAAEHYISDMLAELCCIAEQSQLKDLGALLRVTLTAVETNRRLR